MADGLRILFVDDDPLAVQLARRELERDDLVFDHRICDSEVSLRRELVEFMPDVVLCDYTIPGFSGPQALALVRRMHPATPVLMISGSIAEETAIECLKQGATDYLLKSSLRRLGPAVRRAVADVRQRQVFEERIERLAHYDTLTGLPNLAHVNDLVVDAIRHARIGGQLMALVILNLDRFRFVDADLGRSLANDVLRAIGAALRAKSRAHDVLARVGPDEFMIALSDVPDARHAGALVQGLLNTVAMPRIIAAHELQISASAGIALYPNDSSDFEGLLHMATEAMREAKETTRGGLQFHSSEIVRHAQQRRQLESGLRHALRRNELSLHYQPQFEIRSGRACGVEALARWFRADGQTVPPAVFIPLAERSGLIGDLGTWALRAGCKAAAEWAGSGAISPTICVNVSTQQICEAFTNEIEHALETSGLPADRLELEITESVLIGDADLTLDCLARWKGLGVRIAVDDFGTGYSNLSYLSRLPIDRLKMDRSLIHGMTKKSKEAAIVRAVISLGRELGFTVLAEGVETEEQLGMLAELGCDQAQGYLLTPPTSAKEARTLMAQRWGARASHAGMKRHRPTINSLAAVMDDLNDTGIRLRLSAHSPVTCWWSTTMNRLAVRSSRSSGSRAMTFTAPVPARKRSSCSAPYLARSCSRATRWPGMDGLALCRALRLRDSEHYTYVLMMVDPGDKRDILVGLGAGADDCVARSTSSEEILARVEVGRRITRLEHSLRVRGEENHRLSLTDPLTGARNRRFLMKYLPREMDRSRRYSRPLAILSCDIDGFKSVNDRYGHEAGDQVLQAFVSRASACLRESIDWIARTGGEEFVIVLPETPLGGASRVAEKLRLAMAGQSVPTRSGPLSATVSIGVTALETAQERASISVAELLRAADQCLYVSKNLGRDCTTCVPAARAAAVMTSALAGART